MGFGPDSISRGEMKTFTLIPQQIFRPSRFIVPSPIAIKQLHLLDARVGGSSVLAQAISVECFSETSMANNALSLPIIAVGQTLELDFCLRGAVYATFVQKDDVADEDMPHISTVPGQLKCLHPKSAHRVAELDTIYDGTYDVPEWCDIRYSDRHWDPMLAFEPVSADDLAHVRAGGVEKITIAGAIMGVVVE